MQDIDISPKQDSGSSNNFLMWHSILKVVTMKETKLILTKLVFYLFIKELKDNT